MEPKQKTSCQATILENRAHRVFKGSGSGTAGFTLVELLVCCTLLGLLTLVCFQGLQGILPAARVDRALGEVVALLEWSRWGAVRMGTSFRVILSSKESTISVFHATENENGEEEIVMVRRLDLQEEHPGVAFGTAEGVVRTSGCKPVDSSGIHLKDHEIRFLPSGTADRCGSVYLIPEQDLSNRADRMRALSVLLTTGRLQTWIYDPFAKSECQDGGKWLPT